MGWPGVIILALIFPIGLFVLAHIFGLLMALMFYLLILLGLMFVGALLARLHESSDRADSEP